MNPLKERRTITTTKAITTLFISSVLLVGFMGMSLSLSQTASATVQGGPPEGSPSEERPTPQCPPGTDRFVQRGFCEADPDLVCPDNAPADAAGDCISPETKPKELECPNRPNVEERGDKCIETNPAAFVCPANAPPNAEGKCQERGRGGAIVDKEPTCATGRGGPGGSPVGTGADTKCEKDVTAQGTQKCPLGTKEIEGQCHVVVAKIPKCPSDDFDLVDPETCQTRPGQGNR